MVGSKKKEKKFMGSNSFSSLNWFCLLFVSEMGFRTILSLSNQGGSAFDFGELEQAIALQGVKIDNDEAKARRLLSLKLLLSFLLL